MNNKIIEVICILVQKMLEEDNPLEDKEMLVNELIGAGYEKEDIEQALELISITPDIIEKNQEKNEKKVNRVYNRVFTLPEKIYLPVDLQGLIQRLIILNILSPDESETLIIKTIQNVYSGLTDSRDIWELLEEIVEDKSKLDIISQEITEFKDYYRSDFKYIN